MPSSGVLVTADEMRQVLFGREEVHRRAQGLTYSFNTFLFFFDFPWYLFTNSTHDFKVINLCCMHAVGHLYHTPDFRPFS